MACARGTRQARGLCLVRRQFSSLSWASVDPDAMSAARPHTVQNFCNGQWATTQNMLTMVDPLNGEPFLNVPDTTREELEPFVQALSRTPKSGLHNPLKNPERYLMLGDVSARVVEIMRSREGEDFLTRLIQRVAPKSDAQARGEVRVTRMFMENFCGDQPRFLARGFTVAGDHSGQQSVGYRWPFGGVAVVAPFNFPLEIPVLQLMGALYMGNRPTLKVPQLQAPVMEQWVRLLHHCGLPQPDMDFLNAGGAVTNDFLVRAQPRVTQFTGGCEVAEKLAVDLRGKVRIEDAGFDWKLLGPDVPTTREGFDFVAFTSDQDAYAYSGQKCSAQSALFMHENWAKAGLEGKLVELARRRNVADLTVGPVITWSNKKFFAFLDQIMKVPGARLVCGGKPLQGTKIPEQYGHWEPTAVHIPLEQFMDHWDTVVNEVFGPFQIMTTYKDSELDLVLQIFERMEHHLTAAIVSNDVEFRMKVLGNTVNGTSYAGIRARTTGAPQNHWFGPAGDPRGAGIGTQEAIRLVWSCHREIITDEYVPKGWTMPKAT